MRFFYSILIIGFLVRCGGKDLEFEDILNTPPAPTDTECTLTDGWSLPPSEIVGGGIGKEGIPSLENPDFLHKSATNFLSGDDLLIGVEINGQVRLFPHRIMDRHEVANDQVGAAKYSLTFCPLTGSTVAISRNDDDSFGVSGLLHNSNLIYYNRATNNFWSQMKLSSIKGENVCESVIPLGTVEMTWEGWQKSVADFVVLDINTGFDKDYSDAFSAAILEHNTPLWPYSPKDNRLKNFEKVYVLFVDGFPKAYPLNLFDEEIKVIRDAILGKEIIIISNKKHELITAYYNVKGLNYSIREGAELMLMQENNRWNIFGSLVSGADSNLTKPQGYMAYWFSAAAMFPNIEIYNPHDQD
ncbi:DUF3179 domain-containing (seleno)protein [Ekhidna sp.]|uniref:DUF3179 domain-containing (seleno)protein n=1 Tax=Ekhidna sp. TaxID=2608089 RepID=UPI0032998B24